MWAVTRTEKPRVGHMPATEQSGARRPYRGQRRTGGHTAWGQQRDVKHEWNKVRGSCWRGESRPTTSRTTGHPASHSRL